MGFYIRFLTILISGIICFSSSVSAEERTGNLSISDFTVHRVTPKKTALNKKMPKLRSVIQPKQKTQNQKKSLNNKSENKIKKMIVVSDIKQKTKKNNSVAKNSKPLKKHMPENKLNKPEKITNQDEFISKINKINEKTKNLTEGGSKNSAYKNSGSDFLKTFSSLSIVILLIFIFAWVYARIKGINPTAILTGKFSEKDLNTFNVLSSSTLGQGKDIHLVEINGKQLVIGSTANNINLLTEIAPEEIEKLKEKKQKPQQPKKENNIDSIEVKLPEEDEMNFEPLESEDKEDFISSDFYSSTYSDVYKDYIDSKDEKKQ